MKECAKVKRMLSRYIDEEAGSADSIMIKAHLDKCSACNKEFLELTRVKGLLSGTKPRTLPQDYIVSRVREKVAAAASQGKRFSLAGMGEFARKLIPVPVAAIIISAAFLVLISTQPAAEDSIEGHLFSGGSATIDMAAELIIGSQN